MLNLMNSNGGTVKLCGLSMPQDEVKIKNKVGYVFGGVDFYPENKIRQITAITKKFYQEWNDERYRELCERFEIDQNKKFKQLSAGMKVKYSLAVALSHNPMLLILDEPTSGLDPAARDDLICMFQEFIEDGEHSILFSTHITSDLEKCADYITYIKQGQILASTDKESFRTGYISVAGKKDQLTEEAQGKIIGLHKHQLGFEGLADALATPVNGDGTRLACIVDEHNVLPDGFALPVAVRLVRDGIQRVIFIGPSDERASVLVPTEEGFSERCRLPTIRSRFPVDELRRHRVHPVREEAWLLQDAEVVHMGFGIDVLGSFPEGALIPRKHGGDAESPVGTPVVRRVFRHDLMVERIFRDRFIEFGPCERLFCLPKLLLMRDGVAAENGGLAVGVFAEFGRGVFGGPEALEGLCPPDERGAAVA
jgi:ABC-2 type transport system ATP-binding protein